jgi:acyl-CoA thioester hydrolase
MYRYTYQHRVRYRECDPMGLVYHAHYVDYFEYARTEALREMGMPYREVEEAGIIMPVVDLVVRYRRPALYDDALEIDAVIEEPPDMRLHIDYQIRRQGETELLTTGHVTLCFVDTARSRPVRAPEMVRGLIENAIRTS